MYHNTSQKGSAIFFAIVATALVLSIALGLNVLVLEGVKTLQDSDKSLKAFYAAETGIEHVLFTDSANGAACAGNVSCLVSNTIPFPLANGASYTLNIVGPSDCPLGVTAYCVQSTGVFFGVSKRVEIER